MTLFKASQQKLHSYDTLISRTQPKTQDSCRLLAMRLQIAKKALHRLFLSRNLPAPMAIYAVKKGEESNDRLQQRFKQQVQKSGLIKKLRARNIFTRKPSKRLERIRALKREGFRTANRKKKFYSNM
jgi:ribosomal protein S21